MKIAAKDAKIRQELQELRKALKKAKKSKQRLHQLWYRTKKEHMKQLKDIEACLKALKRSLAKPTRIKKINDKGRI